MTPLLHTCTMATFVSNEEDDSGQTFESEIDVVAFKEDIDSFAKRVDEHLELNSYERTKSRTAEELSIEGDRLLKQLGDFYREGVANIQKRVLASMGFSIEDLEDDDKEEQFVETWYEEQLAWEMIYGDMLDGTLTSALKKFNKRNDAMVTSIEKHGSDAPVDSRTTMKDVQGENGSESITFQDANGFAMDLADRGAEEIDAISARRLGRGSETNDVIYRLDLGDRRKCKGDSHLVSTVLGMLVLANDEGAKYFEEDVRMLYRLYNGVSLKGLKDLGLAFVSAS